MENDLTLSEMKQMQFKLYKKIKKSGMTWIQKLRKVICFIWWKKWENVLYRSFKLIGYS